MPPRGRGRLTVEQWLNKARALLREEEGGYALASYDEFDDTGAPIYSAEDTNKVLVNASEARHGVYVILDKEGMIVAECAIGRQGTRTTPERFSSERQQVQLMSAVGESWERQNQTLERQLDKAHARIEKLEKTIHERDLEIVGLKEQLFESINEDTSEPFAELLKEGMQMVKGQQTQAGLIEQLNKTGILNLLSPGAQAEVVGLINSGAIVKSGLGQSS